MSFVWQPENFKPGLKLTEEYFFPKQMFLAAFESWDPGVNKVIQDHMQKRKPNTTNLTAKLQNSNQNSLLPLV